MSQIQCVTHTLLVSIKKNLSLLLKIRNELIKKGSQLNTVDDNVYSVGLYDVPQRFLRILKGQFILFLLLKLGSTEGTPYDKAGTGVCFPLAAALFTLHYISPPFVDFNYLFHPYKGDTTLTILNFLLKFNS